MLEMNFGGKRAFTLVEAMIAVVIGSMVILVMYSLFSSGVRSTMKGSDTVESIRAAIELFSEIRKDLLACSDVYVENAAGKKIVQKISLGGTFVAPKSQDLGEKIVFVFPNATYTYSLITANGKSLVQKEIISKGVVTPGKEFGTSRVENFGSIEIIREQQISQQSLYKLPDFVHRQIFVTIDIDSKDPRFPSKNLRMESFFITSQLSSNNWNFYY